MERVAVWPGEGIEEIAGLDFANRPAEMEAVRHNGKESLSIL